VLLIEAFKFVSNGVSCKVSVIIRVTASREAKLVRRAKGAAPQPYDGDLEGGPPRKLVQVEEPSVLKGFHGFGLTRQSV
jgi:hypothetical protein